MSSPGLVRKAGAARRGNERPRAAPDKDRFLTKRLSGVLFMPHIFKLTSEGPGATKGKSLSSGALGERAACRFTESALRKSTQEEVRTAH